MSSLLVWIRGQMIRFLERIDKQIFSPSTPLETISICVESLRSQANNTLRHSGIDLLFLVDAHLRRNVERTICEHRDKHVDAVKLRAQEDKWEPINCFNKAGTERFLEEMATAGLPSVRSYVQDQCFVVLTRNTTSFSLSYLNLADSLLRLYCPSMRYLPGVPTSFGQEVSKKTAKCYEQRNNSSKCVYILAKLCRSHFNLTTFFDRKNFNIVISRKFEILTKTSLLKLVGTPCICLLSI